MSAWYMNRSDDYVGDLLQQAQAGDAEQLRRQHAAVLRLLNEMETGVTLVPPDAGRFWSSQAHRAYAARLGDLRRTLAHAHAGLRAALAGIEAELAELADRAGRADPAPP